MRPAGVGSGCSIGLVRILCIQGRHNHGDSVAGTHLAATGNLRRSDTGEAVKTINFSRLGLWALGLLIALLLPYVLVSGYQLRLIIVVGVYILLNMGLNFMLGYAGLLLITQVGCFAIGAYFTAIKSEKCL